MKTRIVALILTVVMSLLALTSCGSFNFAKEDLTSYATFDYEAFKAALVAKATINGVDATISGSYIYTDAILATGFADIYTFVLSYDGVVMQTLTYSVNTYACKMKDNAEMSELALALYRYGVSAKAYIG